MSTRSRVPLTREQRDARRREQLDQLRQATSASAHERRLAALAAHALALPPLLAAQHDADRLPVPTRDPRRRLPPLARTRPLRAQGREGDPHLRPDPLPPPRQRAERQRGSGRAAGRLQARRRLRRLPDRAAAGRRSGTARPARRAGHGRQPRRTARSTRTACRLARLHGQLRAARRPRRLLLRPRGTHRHRHRPSCRTGR